MRLFNRFWERHETNKRALETNNQVKQTADEQADVVKAISQDADARAQRLRAANHRNHYSEGLTESFRGRLT